MKNIFVCALAFMVMATTAFAIDFAPTVMNLSASPSIQYDFDGSPIEIPVTVSGKSGTIYLVINTKDKAGDIGIVHNGFLGWHYVNKIDTCVYLSAPVNIDVGNNLIEWDGKDNDGNIVPASDYTYYMWTYDHISPRIPATRVLYFDGRKGVQIEPYDDQGQIVEKPILYETSTGSGNNWRDRTTLRKWVLGSDPVDSTLVETTHTEGSARWSYTALNPENQKEFFIMEPTGEATPDLYRVNKFEWVPNGEAIKDMAWGDDGEFQFQTSGIWAHWQSGVITDRQGTLYVTNQDISGTGTESELIYIDMDEGVEIQRVDLSDWWVDLGDSEAGGQAGGGPTTIIMYNDYIYTSSHTSCIRQMLDPFAEDEDDIVKWTNGNGDYISDHNFEETSDRPWVCNDYNVAPFMYCTSADANNFSVFTANVMGAVSFGLVAPDGTGIGYLPFSGDSSESKYGQMFLDVGSAYDGMYIDNFTNEEEEERIGIFWVASESIKGVITSSPIAVEENAPTAFAVAQNSPNPFNPTTTISFTIPEADNVTIEVFNVAGQKVDTIAGEYLSAGSHSVSWDASGVSAGVYFYTVKSGEFSKTMKMTLLK